tara:strand:+ start:40 stop:693 length:654 start_codon:yes stop_codon:yes gene_type:complete
MVDISDTPFGDFEPKTKKVSPSTTSKFPTPAFASDITPTSVAMNALKEGFITRAEAMDFMQRMGKDDGTALRQLNAKLPASMRYNKIPMELTEVFKSAGLFPMTRGNKPERINVTNVAKETFEEVANLDLPESQKAETFVERFMNKTKNIASRPAVMNLARRFVSLFFGGPSTIGADLMPVPDTLVETLGMTKPEVQTFKGGGIASIFDTIKPIGDR